MSFEHLIFLQKYYVFFVTRVVEYFNYLQCHKVTWLVTITHVDEIIILVYILMSIFSAPLELPESLSLRRVFECQPQLRHDLLSYLSSHLEGQRCTVNSKGDKMLLSHSFISGNIAFFFSGALRAKTKNSIFTCVPRSNFSRTPRDRTTSKACQIKKKTLYIPKQNEDLE